MPTKYLLIGEGGGVGWGGMGWEGYKNKMNQKPHEQLYIFFV